MPRPRKTEKTGSVTATVKEETKTKLEALAKTKGISSRQLVGQILEDYLASVEAQEDKDSEGYRVGSKVDRNAPEDWKYEFDVIWGYTGGNGKKWKEDRSSFVAHGLLWEGRKQTNGTVNHYKAMLEVPEEAQTVFKSKSDTNRQTSILVEALRAYKAIQSIPGYASLPTERRWRVLNKEDIFQDIYRGVLDNNLKAAVSEATEDIKNSLRDMDIPHEPEAPGNSGKPQPSEEVQTLVEAIESGIESPSSDIQVPIETVETSEEVLTANQALERFKVSKNALNRLKLEGALDVPGGYLTKRQKPGSNSNELVYVSSKTPIAC